MRCYTPQHLADMFGLYFVRNKDKWYGCETVPLFVVDSWKLEKVCVVVLARYVLSVASDKESLTSPETIKNGVL